MNLFLLKFDDLSEIKEIRFLQKDNNKKKQKQKIFWNQWSILVSSFWEHD